MHKAFLFQGETDYKFNFVKNTRSMFGHYVFCSFSLLCIRKFNLFDFCAHNHSIQNVWLCFCYLFSRWFELGLHSAFWWMHFIFNERGYWIHGRSWETTQTANEKIQKQIKNNPQNYRIEKRVNRHFFLSSFISFAFETSSEKANCDLHNTTHILVNTSNEIKKIVMDSCLLFIRNIRKKDSRHVKDKIGMRKPKKKSNRKNKSHESNNMHFRSDQDEELYFGCKWLNHFVCFCCGKFAMARFLHACSFFFHELIKNKIGSF